MSQQIGLFSLGADEDQISKLGAFYSYIIEFGVCKEGSDIKAFGAGIASSFGELKVFLLRKEYLYWQSFGEKKVEFRPLNPKKELPLNYPIQTIQQWYYVAESFQHATETLIHYGESLNRSFQVSYDESKQIV